MPPQIFLTNSQAKRIDDITSGGINPPPAPTRKWVDVPTPERKWVDVPSSDEVLTGIDTSSYSPHLPFGSKYAQAPPEPEQSSFEKYRKMYDDSFLNKSLIPDTIDFMGDTVDITPEHIRDVIDPPEKRNTKDALKLPDWLPPFAGVDLAGLSKYPDWVPFFHGASIMSPIAGAAQGGMQVLKSLATPGNIMSMAALGYAPNVGATTGIPALGKLTNLIGRGLTAPYAASGASKIYDQMHSDKPLDWGELGLNIGETAGGLAGALSPYHPIASKAAATAAHGAGTPPPPGPPAGPIPRPNFSPFGKWAEPTEQPRLAGTEGIDLSPVNSPPHTQLGLEEIPPEGPQPQQMDLPGGALSWGNVPEPTRNAEGQYNLFQNAPNSFEGVPRQTPFQVLPTTPTMADMAPVRSPVNIRPQLEQSGMRNPNQIAGVSFTNSNTALLIHPSQTNMALLTQRGFEATGKILDGHPVWTRPEGLGNTAFSQAQVPVAGPSNIEGMPATRIPLGEGEGFILEKRFVSRSKIHQLRGDGYIVGDTLPNGDIHMVPAEIQNPTHEIHEPLPSEPDVSGLMDKLRQSIDKGGSGRTTANVDPLGMGMAYDLLRERWRRMRMEHPDIDTWLTHPFGNDTPIEDYVDVSNPRAMREEMDMYNRDRAALAPNQNPVINPGDELRFPPRQPEPVRQPSYGSNFVPDTPEAITAAASVKEPRAPIGDSSVSLQDTPYSRRPNPFDENSAYTDPLGVNALMNLMRNRNRTPPIEEPQRMQTKGKYYDYEPERYKRYHIYDENDNLVDKTNDIHEADDWADRHNGSIKDMGPEEMPQKMNVPGVREGKGGLENIAMGGASARVLDVIGSSLYSRSRPVTTIKELMQNSFDEHKEYGITEPVRVMFDDSADVPGSKTKYRSVTVRDRGKGLEPDEMYTVLTNLGETGKAGVESASGGFGFAKAAPFLGGGYVRVTSIVDVVKKGISTRMKYSFEGNPIQLKDQAKGVPLNAEPVSKDIPTGLEVTTFYPPDTPGVWDAKSFAKNMAEGSPSSPGGIIFNDASYSGKIDQRAWLDETPSKPAPNSSLFSLSTHKPQPLPPLMDTIKTPGAEVNIHYRTDPAVEASGANLHMLNKGMYQGTDLVGYGSVTKNVPTAIFADIKATVEEGIPGYPFSANREQLDAGVKSAISDWVDANIVSGVMKNRIKGMQAAYDGIAPLPNTSVSFLDAGDKFTPQEIQAIDSHPSFIKAVNALEYTHSRILALTDSLGWGPLHYSATWKLPSERLKKFGLLFQEPNSKGETTLGIHIPRANDMNNSAILINLMEHIRLEPSLDKLVTSLFTTVAHEQAHIPGGSHDQAFAYRDAQLRAKLGESLSTGLYQELRRGFDDGNGNIDPGLHKVLSIYDASRQRPASGTGDLIASGIGSKRPAGNTVGKKENLTGFDDSGKESEAGAPVEKKQSLFRKSYNFVRGSTTTMDLSAPLRQGLPMIHTKAFWQSMRPMIDSLGSEAAFQKSLSDLRHRKLFQRQYDRSTGEVVKSFAEMVGMKLSDLNEHLSNREESIVSDWVETGGFLGKDVPYLNRPTKAQAMYQGSIGKGARATNRAYTAYLNQLRADSFESLMADAFRDFKANTKGAKNPYTDLEFARQISDYINTATGRGPFKLAAPGVIGDRLGLGGKLGIKEYSFDGAANVLSNVFFSPKLMMSRMRMLNPATYMMASPFVRKQYLKSLLSVAGFATVMGGLAKIGGADVSLDPNSADFMKIKIGNTRLDMMGGFQQYVVAASRVLTGHTTSSASGTDFELGSGYRAPTTGTIEQNFLTNKLHPVLKFANDIAFASTHQPFQVGDRTLQLFIPLIVGDVLELAREDPKLLPMVAPIALGAGSQTYDKGATPNKYLLDSNGDLPLKLCRMESMTNSTKGFEPATLTSGSQVFPWNWGGINKGQ